MRCSVATFLLWAIGLAISVPVFAQSGGDFVRTTIELPDGFTAQAITYDSSGTLFVASSGQNSIVAIDRDGTQRTIDLSPGVSLDVVGGATIDPTNGRLLITDQDMFATPGGSIVSVDTNTGIAETLFSGNELSDVAGIAVRSTGEIFVTTFGSSATGSVFQIDNSSGVGTATQIVSGLDSAAGIRFDSQGDLIFQNANDGRDVSQGGDGSGDFTAEIRRLAITETAAGLSIDPISEQIIASTTGEFNFIFDSEGDIFTIGTLGLFELERDAAGEFTGNEERLLLDLNLDSSRTLSFLPGSTIFDIDQTIVAGQLSPLLSFTPDFSDNQIITLSLPVTAVPEPASSSILICMLIPYLARRRRA